ncbi:MAG: aryl-sulfate sulfotransferase [Pseudomonadota bacterium]
MIFGLALPLALLAACAPPGEDSATPEGSVVAAGVVGWIEPSAALPTVVTVRWRTPNAQRGWLRYLGEGQETWTELEDGEATVAHRQVLRGLAAATSYQVEVAPDPDSDQVLALSFTTGALPSWVPALDMDDADPEASQEAFLVGPLAGEEPDTLPVILDSEGRVVWYHPDAGPVTRVRITPDRQALVALLHSSAVDVPGCLQWLDWEGGLLRERCFEGIHTDFTFLPGGRIAVLGRELRDLATGRTFLGQTILEVDPDGGGGVVWSVLDARPPNLDRIFPPCAEASGAECYAHVNSISYAEVDDAYLLTASDLGAVLAVDRSTGDVRWALGGEQSDFSVPGYEKPFSYPHSVQAVPGGVLVYDNWSPLLDGCSGAAQFSLDFDLAQATPTWRYAAEECVVNNFLGNAQRLWDGRTLVVNPAAGFLDLVDAEEALDQRISTGEGVVLRFAQAAESLYF